MTAPAGLKSPRRLLLAAGSGSLLKGVSFAPGDPDLRQSFLEERSFDEARAGKILTRWFHLFHGRFRILVPRRVMIDLRWARDGQEAARYATGELVAAETFAKLEETVFAKLSEPAIDALFAGSALILELYGARMERIGVRLSLSETGGVTYAMMNQLKTVSLTLQPWAQELRGWFSGTQFLGLRFDVLPSMHTRAELTRLPGRRPAQGARR